MQTVADLLDTTEVPIVINWTTDGSVENRTTDGDVEPAHNANPEGHNQYTTGGGFHVHQPNVLRARAGIHEYRIGYDEKSGQHHVQTARVRPNGKLERPEVLGKFDTLQKAKNAVIAHGRSKGRELIGNADDDIQQWITVGGAHIPIRKGESKDDVVKAHLAKIESQETRAKQTQAVSKEHSEEEQGKDWGKFAKGRETESHGGPVSSPSAILASMKQASAHITGLKTALGQKVWDAMTPGQQAGYTAVKAGVDKVEHALEGAYKAGQNAAKEVMKEQGMSAEHIETAGKLLGAVDGIAKWTVNIPVAHEAIHALTHIGGPIAFLGAKVGYYTPVASLAYVGASLAKAAGQDIKKAVLGSKDPYQTIKIARAAIRGVMAKQAHGESHAAAGAAAHGVAGAVSYLSPAAGAAIRSLEHHADPKSPNVTQMKANAPKIAKYLKDHDYKPHCVALLYGALDETMTKDGPDLDKAIKYADMADEKMED